MKKLGLSLQGRNKGKYFALVDDKDFLNLSKFRWVYLSSGYAARKEGKKFILMHRVVANTPMGKLTDHINGNKLDNRRVNLRAVSSNENNRYRPKQRNNTSGFKGVSWHRSLKYWMAYIKLNGKKIHLGYFKSPEEGAQAYNKAAKIYHGKFAILNILT